MHDCADFAVEPIIEENSAAIQTSMRNCLIHIENFDTATIESADEYEFDIGSKQPVRFYNVIVSATNGFGN